MDNKKIWLSSPHMSGNEITYVQNAFNENWIAPLGPHVDAFENQLQKIAQVEHAAALSSGTASLHLGLILSNVGEGDIVICQSFTFSASANPIVYQGAQPVFIDSESDTWNMDPNLLRQSIEDFISIGKKPKAIIPVHLYGMPAKMKEIITISKEFDIDVIEDAAEALGASLDNKPCGSFGNFGVLSFNGNKIITTSGGGALLGSNAALIEKARYLATQSRDPAPHYQHSEVGYNYRMSNVLAGIGRGQLDVLTDRVLSRRKIFTQYHSYFKHWNERGFDIRFQPEIAGAYSNRWLTTILIDPSTNNGLTREVLRLALDAENIESRPLWKPMHQQPVFASAKAYLNGTSDRLFSQGLCLPSGSNLTVYEIQRIFSSLDNIFQQYI